MPKHSERFRVAWVDTDAGGRIHFTAAFRWAEAAETGLFRKLGLLAGGYESYPRRHVAAEYRRVLVFEDEIEVRLHVERVGNTSITFRWDIVRDGELAIEGTHTVVRVDAEGLALPLDDTVRELLT
jgi:acyl-CoA thioester hydrolase